MPHSVRSFVIGLLLGTCPFAGVAESSPFADKHLGKCFKSPKAFVSVALGNEALNDPNISLSKKGLWIWIVDRTASTNYSWYLLKKSGNRFCLQGFVPAASYVDLQETRSTVRAEAFIPPLPGFPAKLITFRTIYPSRVLRPDRCYEIEDLDCKAVSCRRQISCDRIYE